MRSAAETVRFLPYPVLESGSLSYENGEYRVTTHTGNDGSSASSAVTLTHKITGAPLVESLLREGKAKYACLVSVPATGYRRLLQSDGPIQKVEWNLGVAGEPPMLRPLVLAVEQVECRLRPEHGVVAAWQGRDLTIPIGGRLALHDYLRVQASVHQLVVLVPDEKMKDGSFKVEECTEDGFYFRVSIARDLLAFLQNPLGHSKHRMSILTHIASRCLELLKERYSSSDPNDTESDWNSYRSLKSLAGELQSKGLPIWADEGFDPAEVATKLYPHEPPSEEPDE